MSHNYAIFGVQGAGKGTQAMILAENLNIPHISTGDLLRHEADKGTKLGLEAKSHWEDGHLVPDELMIPMFQERFSEKDCEDGFILDGFPRNIDQGKAMGHMLKAMGRKFDAILLIEITESELLERLRYRWLCRSCAMIYNTLYAPPKREGICDQCGGELYQREDDVDKAAVNKRVEIYRSSTAGVISYYRSLGLVTEINGSQSIGDVAREIADKLGLEE